MSGVQPDLELGHMDGPGASPGVVRPYQGAIPVSDIGALSEADGEASGESTDDYEDEDEGEDPLERSFFERLKPLLAQNDFPLLFGPFALDFSGYTWIYLRYLEDKLLRDTQKFHGLAKSPNAPTTVEPALVKSIGRRLLEHGMPQTFTIDITLPLNV
jgi:hypothetical protein